MVPYPPPPKIYFLFLLTNDCLSSGTVLLSSKQLPFTILTLLRKTISCL